MNSLEQARNAVVFASSQVKDPKSAFEFVRLLREFEDAVREDETLRTASRLAEARLDFERHSFNG